MLRPTDTGVKFDAGADLAAYDWVNMSGGLVELTATGALRGIWPAANMTDTLTVRASGTLAGNVGPIMQVFADGILLGSFEIRSSSPTYFKLAALPLQVGQIIEVRHTNPAPSRNLKVDYAMSGRTVLQATGGALNAAWPAANLTDTLNIRARADVAGGTGAIMQVLVDNLLVGTAEVNSTVNADYQFAVPPMSAGRKINLVYINDGQVNGVDRNLYIAYLTTANTALLPTAAGNTFDRGFGGAGFDGVDVVAGTGNLTTNGALHINWPAANITSTVTVRASATPAGNTGALMTLWVNGVAVSATH
ncbi:carbohydrate-binding domain-containing protein, partial [Roseateles sp. LYH14W]|uniref:carbohydrate-binding domain-containing protein n=1 Tax=Pelomonas parva TaxID=3299032 RepID=UPI00374969AA